METQEEVITMGSKQQTHIAKKKRTKRQRPHSPIDYKNVSNSITSTNNNGSGLKLIAWVDHEDANTNNNNNIIRQVSPTPTQSLSNEHSMDITEEEEDVANCLMLLAQGRSKDQTQKQSSYDFNQMGTNKNYRFNSRRFLETSSTGNGTTEGYYVYECKTCNRTFPSFQALGGHRASHKKPKTNHTDYDKEHLSTMEKEDGVVDYRKNNQFSSFLSLQLSNKEMYMNINNNSVKKGNKFHECSICGAEFTSGQALGGHMRRHRGSIGANTTLSLITAPVAMPFEVDKRNQGKKPKNDSYLDLDLNLPAPVDDKNNTHRELKFPFRSESKQEQYAPPVFSPTTLVGCHY